MLKVAKTHCEKNKYSSIVIKFGGSSLASLDDIMSAANQVAKICQKGIPIVVVSAMGDETNQLESLCALSGSKEKDKVLATGEQKSAALMSLCLQNLGIKAQSFLAHEIPIVTDDQFGNANIRSICQQKLTRALADQIVPVIAGYQGVTKDGYITTLGRDGSDTTAVAVAAAMGIDNCVICTDVNGVFSVDPRINRPLSQPIPYLSYKEMMDLTNNGAKILHRKALELAEVHGISIRVCSNRLDSQGSIIGNLKLINESREGGSENVSNAN